MYLTFQFNKQDNNTYLHIHVHTITVSLETDLSLCASTDGQPLYIDLLLHDTKYQYVYTEQQMIYKHGYTVYSVLYKEDILGL